MPSPLHRGLQKGPATGCADEASGSMIPGHSFCKSYNHLPEIKERGTDPSLQEIIFSFPISDEMDRSNPASCGRSCIRSACLPGEQRRHPGAVLSAGGLFPPLPGQTARPSHLDVCSLCAPSLPSPQSRFPLSSLRPCTWEQSFPSATVTLWLLLTRKLAPRRPPATEGDKFKWLLLGSTVET